MSLFFRILPQHGLVYVRYDGVIDPASTAKVFAEYTAHPDRRPGQKQLVDLSGVTGLSADYVDVMKVQAQKADVFLDGAAQVMVAYYAPSPVAWRVSAMILKSWEGLPAVVARVFREEETVLDFLGVPERSFSRLLQTA